jgi:mono/diheme cytochrome c family protein
LPEVTAFIYLKGYPMKKQLFVLSIAVCLVSAYALLNAGSPTISSHAGPVSYAQDVRPILQGRCGACHMGEMATKGLNMETHASLLAGSQNGPVIIPGDARGSLLVKKLTAGEMPKRGPKLTPAQIQLIIDWINAGALDN